MPVIQHIGRWGSATVERYVAEALAGKAEWAPLLAATELDLTEIVGGDGHSSGPGLGAIASVIGKLVKAEVKKHGKITKGSKRKSSKAGLDEPAAEAGVVSQPKDGVLVEAPPPAAVTAASSSSAGPSGRSFVKSVRTGVGHLVRFAGDGLLPEQWETECGWRSGRARHAPCDIAAVSCSRCKMALRLQ